MAGICILIAACGGTSKRVAGTTTAGTTTTAGGPNASGTADQPGSPAVGTSNSQRAEQPSREKTTTGKVTSRHDSPRSATRTAHHHRTTPTRTTTVAHPATGAPRTRSTHAGGSAHHAGSSTSAPVHTAAKHQFDLTEVMHVTSRRAAVFFEKGSATGPPIGRGTVVLQAQLTAGGVVVTSFTVDASGGSFTGQARTHAHLGGGHVHYRGTSQLTRGTGDYHDVHGSQITVTGTGNLKGRTTLHLTGFAYY